MAPTNNSSSSTNDFTGFAEALGNAAAQFQSGWMELMSPYANKQGEAFAVGDSLPSFSPDLADARLDSGKVLANQLQLWRDYQTLWISTTARMMGREASPVIKPDQGDHRFKDAEWTDNPIFDFIKQSYLLNARWMRQTMTGVNGLDADSVQKLDFFGRMIIDALSPTNFALTNPQVLREMAETKGENLVRGMQKLHEDLREGRDGLRPKHTDMTAFEVGRDVATTPGSVVHQTPFMQLIQYSPTTEKVYKKPLLIVPPWINKFYILDLKPENSFVRWATEQGYSVFMVSWVNPDESLATKSFDDYVRDGIFAALEGVERATGERQVTAIGYCIGGTLLSATLAHMAATGDDRIAAATFFAAQVDFQNAGDLRVFTDEAQVNLLENKVRTKGYLDGAQMAGTFNALRANDLIWHFVINNYLLGKEPPVFDLLFWNADSTRFPAQLLMDYLRNMYQRNALAQKGQFTLLGTPLDLSAIKVPAYIQASVDDHIAPAASVFKLNHIFGGQKRFVLAGAGHIAGVVNPPKKQKYQHWINTKRKAYQTFDAWLEDAEEHPGSWWPDWHRWLSRRSGPKVAARIVEEGGAEIIEPAPGSYVKVRS